jgi:cell cycle checkpoint control protein RAD9A
VAIDVLDFEQFSVEEKLHIAISVKDFKAIMTHAGTFSTSVRADYSHPTRPMQLAYESEGIRCEFILMTTYHLKEGNATLANGSVRAGGPRPRSKQGSVSAAARPTPPAAIVSRRLQVPAADAAMPPPASRPTPRESPTELTKAPINRPSPPPPQASLEASGLFVPENDNDRRWNADDSDENDDDDDGGMLGWGVGADNVSRLSGLACAFAIDLFFLGHSCHKL